MSIIYNTSFYLPARTVCGIAANVPELAQFLSKGARVFPDASMPI